MKKVSVVKISNINNVWYDELTVQQYDMFKMKIKEAIKCLFLIFKLNK